MKQRIITAIVLLIIVVPCLMLGGIYFEGFVAIASALALYEVCKLTKNSTVGYIKDALYIIYGVALILGFTFTSMSNHLFLLLVVLFMFSIISEKITMEDVLIQYTFGVLVIGGLKAIHDLSLPTLVFIALATYGSDTGAYFTGVKFGKHKLIPRLSPKKTIEGSIGGIVLGTLLAVLFYNYNGAVELNSFIQAIVVAFVLTITAQFGDLTFSSVKRYVGIKDFSNLLPGHGGVLDRLDSLMFNALVFTIIALL